MLRLTNADWQQLERLFSERGPAKHYLRRLEDILWKDRGTVAPMCRAPLGRGVTCVRALSNSGSGHISGRLRVRWLGEDHEALYLGSTSVKAHRHSTGVRGKAEEASGRSRDAGRDTEIHAG